LDPFNKCTDHEVWTALEQTRLKEVISRVDGKLSGHVLPGGANFSVGQRQLFCLARALLRKSNILIMDEATASVDPDTDELIQKMIRSEFKDSTVITIAHRLNTIADSDRILVLGNGEVKEFDTPKNLLQNPDSMYAKLMQDESKSPSPTLKPQTPTDDPNSLPIPGPMSSPGQGHRSLSIPSDHQDELVTSPLSHATGTGLGLGIGKAAIAGEEENGEEVEDDASLLSEEGDRQD